MRWRDEHSIAGKRMQLNRRISVICSSCVNCPSFRLCEEKTCYAPADQNGTLTESPTISRHVCFFFDIGGVCSTQFRHKRAQPKTQRSRSALILPAAFADINMATDRPYTE